MEDEDIGEDTLKRYQVRVLSQEDFAR